MFELTSIASPFVMLAEAGTHDKVPQMRGLPWVPACAGMTKKWTRVRQPVRNTRDGERTLA
jgi:hypothetical protein